LRSVVCVKQSKGEQNEQGGHRGITVVTVVTLVFAPVLAHNRWFWRLVDRTEATHVEQCEAKEPCPKQKRIVNVVRQDPPATPKQRH
jgi:hypothetical protein